MKSLALGMMIAVSVFASGQTKEDSKQATIDIGMLLRLGMARDAIITKLIGNYKVVKIDVGEDEWLVEEKDNPLVTIGHLGFKAGKLTYASRDWTQGQEDNYDFAQAIWGVMSHMDQEGNRSCSFDVPSSRSPQAEMTYVRLYCGAKRVQITTTNVLNGTGKGHYAAVSEILSSEQGR